MNPPSELLDARTQMALREAAPQVTSVPWDLARPAGVRATAITLPGRKISSIF